MTQRQILLGWITAFAIAVSWVFIVVGFSDAWESERAPWIKQGTPWILPQTTMSIESMKIFHEIPQSRGTPAKPMDGAVFVVVTASFSVSGDLPYQCIVSLVGDGREWSATRSSIFLDHEKAGTVSSCQTTDENDSPILEGRVAELFEIPQSAIAEIQGVRIALMDPHIDLGDQRTTYTFTDDHEAVLRGTLQ
ncbi:MAG: hypothetical protein LBG99_06430 [Propionibacteriaceae bacterium]|jgi:hypothetical protein|nr:hypothetical protein [Propionibacteriaceae bacterium]